MSVEVIHGDCVAVMAAMDAESVDAIVTDPPYGLEFMGKEWDAFRVDDPGTIRHRGERAGVHGSLPPEAATGLTPGSRSRASYGGGKRPHTYRCVGCGKRDQFRNAHACPEGTRWARELIDPFSAPPTMLAFGEWTRQWARAAYRVLKPGGYLLAFGGTRTYHRMACAVEDAGFEIRDQIMWLYGTGFPKSLDVSKAIDETAGAKRRVVGSKMGMTPERPLSGGLFRDDMWMPSGKQIPIDLPATDAAREWSGWGTALKPAHEPIVVARKPLIGTVTENVLKHGTGAINVDGCRIGIAQDEPNRRSTPSSATPGMFGVTGHNGTLAEGRWPANVILDEDAGTMLDAQSGVSQHHRSGERRGGIWASTGDGGTIAAPGDTGGASRFFYCPKASREEREAGLTAMPTSERRCLGDFEGTPEHGPKKDVRARNHHPTVKPIALMRYLIRLVTPPSGTVLDPFLGSGTTLMAVALEGFDAIGIEREEEYVEIAKVRIAEVERQIEILARQGTLDL